MGHEQDRDPITIIPLDLGRLEFTAHNGEEYFKILFFRNDEEKIAKFVLAASVSESSAERVSETARPTPHFSGVRTQGYATSVAS